MTNRPDTMTDHPSSIYADRVTLRGKRQFTRLSVDLWAASGEITISREDVYLRPFYKTDDRSAPRPLLILDLLDAQRLVRKLQALIDAAKYAPLHHHMTTGDDT